MKEYTVKAHDLAKYFSVSHKTIMNWFHKHDLPGLQVGGAIRFNLEEVQKWIEKKKELKN